MIQASVDLIGKWMVKGKYFVHIIGVIFNQIKWIKDWSYGKDDQTTV